MPPPPPLWLFRSQSRAWLRGVPMASTVAGRSALAARLAPLGSSCRIIGGELDSSKSCAACGGLGYSPGPLARCGRCAGTVARS